MDGTAHKSASGHCRISRRARDYFTPPPPHGWELLAEVNAGATKSIRHDGLAHGASTYYRIAGRTPSDTCAYTEPLRVTTLDAEVELDINGEQGFNAQDALIMYYAFTFPEVLGGTFGTPGYAEIRDELLGELTTRTTPTSDTLIGFLQTARRLARKHRNSMLDINADGQVDAGDSLIMYYADSLPPLVGNDDGQVPNAIWQTFISPFRAIRDSPSNHVRQLLNRANSLNYR